VADNLWKVVKEHKPMLLSLWLFGCGAAFLIYTLIGYPALLWLLARRPVPAQRKTFYPKSVTVLLPVHNGAQWIGNKLESLLSMEYPREFLKIIVISDGSTDGTDQVAAAYADRSVRLLHIPKAGKAVALNRGMDLADGEILFFSDVRQRVDSQCLRNIVSCFEDTKVGGVCGELVILSGETQEETAVGLYWKLEKWIRTQLSRTGTLLVVTGCLYAVRRELVDPLPEDALGDDIYTPQAVLRKGYRVVFESTAKAYDYPTTLDVEFGRKVRTLAGLYQYVLQYGLGPYPFHFFSYKVSRVLLPYALLLVALTSPFLGFPWSVAAVGAQVTFYGLAALDSWISEKSLVKRISSSARTFCTLMWAAVMAASVMFVPASTLWKTTHVRQPKSPVV